MRSLIFLRLGDGTGDLADVFLVEVTANNDELDLSGSDADHFVAVTVLERGGTHKVKDG